MVFDAAYCVACLGSDDYYLIGPCIGVAIFSALCFALPIISYVKTSIGIKLKEVFIIFLIKNL